MSYSLSLFVYTCYITQLTHDLFVVINGHFRNLKWRYLPYIRPI